MGLDSFHIVLVNSDRNRPLNGLDGNHQRTVSVACGQEAFDAVQRATTDSHALADLQKRTECVRNISRQKHLKVFNLALGDGTAFAADAHEPQHAIGLHHLVPKLRQKLDVYECIAGEQRQLNDLPAIAPAMDLADQREKSLDSTPFKLIDHELLVPRAGVNGVPLRLGDWRR